MNTCQNCRHWRPQGKDPLYFNVGWLPDPFGTCAAIPTDDLELVKDEAIAVVTTDCAANLVTAPTFGCVLWEGKA